MEDFVKEMTQQKEVVKEKQEERENTRKEKLKKGKEKEREKPDAEKKELKEKLEKKDVNVFLIVYFVFHQLIRYYFLFSKQQCYFHTFFSI